MTIWVDKSVSPFDPLIKNKLGLYEDDQKLLWAKTGIDALLLMAMGSFDKIIINDIDDMDFDKIKNRFLYLKERFPKKYSTSFIQNFKNKDWKL
jgi:hypothetical protein